MDLVAIKQAIKNNDVEYFANKNYFNHIGVINLILDNFEFLKLVFERYQIDSKIYIDVLLIHKKQDVQVLKYLLPKLRLMRVLFYYYFIINSYPNIKYGCALVKYCKKRYIPLNISNNQFDETNTESRLKYYDRIGIKLSPFTAIWARCKDKEFVGKHVNEKTIREEIRLSHEADHETGYAQPIHIRYLLQDNLNFYIRRGLDVNQSNGSFLLEEGSQQLIKYGAILPQLCDKSSSCRSYETYRILQMYENISNKFIKKYKNLDWRLISICWSAICHPYKFDTNIGKIRGLAGILGISDYKYLNRTQLCAFIGTVIVLKYFTQYHIMWGGAPHPI